jgi:uncharacterized Tic20 family protein
MPFGSPRPIFTIVNLLFILAGICILTVVNSWLRWLGIPLILWGVFTGLIMGSWSQLLPGSKPIGKRQESTDDT